MTDWPTPTRPTNLRSAVLPAGSTWWNVAHAAHADKPYNASGRGDARFSPLTQADGTTPLPHLSLALNPVCALLETVFHDVWGNAALVVAAADIKDQILRHGELTRPVRVVDLHDTQLTQYGLRRDHLISSSGNHYPHTREWAALLAGTSVGGHPTYGLRWESRIVELAATAVPPLQATLFTGDQTETAVLYDLDGQPCPFSVTEEVPLDTGAGHDYVLELGGWVDVIIQ